MSVKVPTAKVIVALEARLLTTQTDHALKEKREAEFQETYKKWEAELKDWALARLSKAENIRTNYRSWNKTLNVDFDIVGSENQFPAEPEKDFDTIHQHTYREQKEEISNAIRMLKMTDEEVVNTSTYNAVARYL
jgi:hypothetical protein